MVSYVDQIYRSILLTKFFTQGWGTPENLRKIFAFRKILSNRETCQSLVDANYPVTVLKKEKKGKYELVEAEFLSPLVHHLPGLLPEESKMARFQMILPTSWTDTQLRPICLHLAGTGDHGFWRRRLFMAKPLLQEAGIGSIILENPFYGCRKPRQQLRSSLRNVSDLFLMGGCLVLESLVILHWCERQGFGPLGITGISMGGHMASLAACNWPKPLPLIPCLSWTTASGVFTQGVLSGAINWEKLKNQYFGDKVFRNELFNMIQSPEGHFRVFHEVGQLFARDFPSSLEHVEKIKKELDYKLKQNMRISPIDVDAKHKIDSSCQLDKMNSSQDSDLNHLRENTDNGIFMTSSHEQIVQNQTMSSGYPTSNNAISYSSGTKNLLFRLKKHCDRQFLKRYQEVMSSFPTVDSCSSQHTPIVIRPATATNTNPVNFDPYVGVKDPLTWEALQFMRGVMDECTHLGNFSIPVDPSLIIIVAAKNDGYMPRDGIIPLTKIWPGSTLRTINRGHIAAFLFHHQAFRDAIKDSFKLLINKHYL